MFASRVAESQTKATASVSSSLAPHHRSTFSAQLLRHDRVDRARLQHTIGNQGMLQLLQRQGAKPGGSVSQHEPEAASESIIALAQSPGTSWDFSKTPLFPPDQANGPQARSLPRGRPVAPRPDFRDALSSPGKPLDETVRQEMAPRYGHNFRDVRVHDDARAARLASSLDASAFAFGDDLVFAAGEYAPRSAQGRRLIAHELAHVVQQPASRLALNTLLVVSDPNSEHERHADLAAGNVITGRSAPPAPALAPAAEVIHRSPESGRARDEDRLKLKQLGLNLPGGIGPPPALGTPQLPMLTLTLPPIGESLRILKFEPSLGVPQLRAPFAFDPHAAAVEAARKLVAAEATKTPFESTAQSRLTEAIKSPPSVPERPGSAEEGPTEGPHPEAGYQQDHAVFQFNLTAKDLAIPNQKGKETQLGLLEPQIALASAPHVPGSIDVRPPLPAQLQLAFNVFDQHVQVLGHELEMTLAPLVTSNFPSFNIFGFGGQAQAELHLTEELSLFASTQLGLQTAQPGPPDFNNTRIGQVKIAGQLYDALWNPISAGVLIHIGAGGGAPERGTSEPVPEPAGDIRAAAREIPVKALATDPDLASPEFKTPEGEPLMPELIARIADKMVSGAAAKEDIRQLEFELPQGVSPPPSMQRMLAKIVDVISIAGHYAPLGHFRQFNLLLYQRDAKGERSFLYVVPSLLSGAPRNL